MKNTLLTLVLLLSGSLFLPLSQADQWPYGSSGFEETEDEDENEDGYPPEGESMPDMDDDEDDSYDSDEDVDFEDVDSSTWLDSDDE